MKERLREVDANLLLALHALLEERNLTHAGERMTMSQPAMSGALARLRKHFDDELLVRVGRGFELSPLAERLQAGRRGGRRGRRGAARQPARVRPDLQHPAVHGEHVGVRDDRPRRAPHPAARRAGARLLGGARTVSTSRPSQFESQLMRRDLILAPLGFDFPGAVSRSSPTTSCASSPATTRGSPTARCRSTTCRRCRTPWRRSGPPASAGARSRSRWSGSGVIGRPVLVQVTCLLTLPFAVSGTEMCAFVPARLAHRCLDILDLAIAETPLEPVQITEAAHWHPRRDTEPASSGCAGCSTTWPSRRGTRAVG